MSAQLGRVNAADIAASFRGDVYGDAAAMTEAWFRDHVERNDIALARSPRWAVGDALSGAALLAFRGERAWVGGFGVVPEFRGRGLAARYLAETLAIARDSGATSVELEVLENNAGALRLYERGGFVHTGALVAWSRKPRSKRDATSRNAVAPVLDARAIAAIARNPPTCWQREPRSVAAAAAFESIVVGAPESPGAYAFVRGDGERATVLDAGARDARSATALLGALDERFGHVTLMLINEPPRGPLHDAFTAHDAWSEFARQRRMRIALR